MEHSPSASAQVADGADSTANNDSELKSDVAQNENISTEPITESAPGDVNNQAGDANSQAVKKDVSCLIMMDIKISCLFRTKLACKLLFNPSRHVNIWIRLSFLFFCWH